VRAVRIDIEVGQRRVGRELQLDAERDEVDKISMANGQKRRRHDGSPGLISGVPKPSSRSTIGRPLNQHRETVSAALTGDIVL
jgi:hypothetical protein